MKKKMFSRFTSILQHAVDALAPQLSLQEEFIYHWKAVTTYFMDNKGEHRPIEQTSIPGHLEQMLVILQQEDGAVERGMYGPCLEYLLQHKLLETLYSLGRTDHPPGMKQTVLSFFTKLLSRIKEPLLAHVSVYKAVQRLIKSCGEIKAGPTEIEEIQFLCTVCAKIKADPYLVNFFLEMPKPVTKSSASAKEPIVEEPSSENKLQQDFHLVSTLLSLSHSEDSRVAVKACEGLMLCSSLPDPVAAHCMINSTKFCDDLTTRLMETYMKLPTNVSPLDIENVQAKWGLEVVTQREDKTTFTGKRHLVSFLSWLDYCDQLSAIANPIVAEALSRNIHQKFLRPVLQPALLQVSENGCITATAYMSRCLRTVCSERLLSELVLFLLGDERKAESKGTPKESLRSRLIERCNGVSEEICLVTLQLFDTLLQKDDEHILHNLVLRNLECRDYLNLSAIKKSVKQGRLASSADGSQSCDSKEEKPKVKDTSSESAEIEYQKEAEPHSQNETVENSDTQNETNCSEKETEQTSNSVTLSEMKESEKLTEHNVQKSEKRSEDNRPDSEVVMKSPLSTPVHLQTEVHKVVNSFLTLLPEDLKSSYQTADGGYDMYLKDAHKQYCAIVETCKSWNLLKDVEKKKPDPSTVFYEGSFLQMIFEKFAHMLDQSYPINLQLTSVISKLALVPHPCLHEFLLDPFLPLKPGVRNLFTVFQKIAKEIKSQYASEPDLAQKLVRVRKKLMGSSASMQRSADESRLEAIIVFEEFCKELSAIVFVKHHAACTEEKKC